MGSALKMGMDRNNLCFGGLDEASLGENKLVFVEKGNSQLRINIWILIKKIYQMKNLLFLIMNQMMKY